MWYSMKKYEIVDFLRGYSIFTIVLMHLCMGYASGALGKALAFGGAGVHVFILCSGFGLYLSYLKNPLGYSNFLRRRFGKVWIPYAIAVLLWAGWYLLSKGFFPLRIVASHLCLYKMFSVELDTSLCYPYWFISTIIQFYLAWPLIVRLVRSQGGYFIALAVSFLWSTMVGILGYEEMRPWGSFFLQYLWEFCLGMWIAEKCMREKENCRLMKICNYRWSWLITGAVGGMGVSALMAWNGGILKLYNDIPSLIGYLSVALLIYKMGVKLVNRFFEWSNNFSYELYLVHSLMFAIMAFYLKGFMPLLELIAISLIAAYAAGYSYSWFLIKTKLK